MPLSGSPPRMRGKAVLASTTLYRSGITPAYAGKRAWFSYCGCQDRDHPRVCGEKALSTFSSRKNSGSPPRMRGKVLCGRSSAGRHGITPAYAEKRGRTIRVNRTVKDYPRVCGEKMVSMIPHRRSRGSPPRMRGKVDLYYFYAPNRRITPAYAGKSLPEADFRPTLRDHPRVCGEKYLQVLPRCFRRGSPPRMRGKGPSLPDAPSLCGITPAYAGKRLKRSHSIGHFSYILCLFHSVLHRASASGGSRAGPCAPPCLPAQNAVPV